MPDERDQIIEELRKEVEELKRIIEMQNEIIRELRNSAKITSHIYMGGQLLLRFNYVIPIT